MTANGSYEFGPFRLDPAQHLLTRDGERVTLAPKTFDLLVVLAGSQGRVLTKTELMQALWPDTFVEEANLSFQVSALRKALGEEGSTWIETLPKHGYRFTAAVARVDRFRGRAASPKPSRPRRARRAGMPPTPGHSRCSVTCEPAPEISRGRAGIWPAWTGSLLRNTSTRPT